MDKLNIFDYFYKIIDVIDNENSNEEYQKNDYNIGYTDGCKSTLSIIREEFKRLEMKYKEKTNNKDVGK